MLLLVRIVREIQQAGNLLLPKQKLHCVGPGYIAMESKTCNGLDVDNAALHLRHLRLATFACRRGLVRFFERYAASET